MPPPMVSGRLLVVIPAHNEAHTVGDVVRHSRALGFETLVVDDGSTDETAVVAREAGARVVELPANVGVGGALRCGFEYAVGRGYERVVQVDADLQHDPGRIATLVDAADRTGAALVVGSRFGTEGFQGSSIRRVPMRLLARWVGRRVGAHLTDVTSGFRLISEPLLSRFAREYPSEYLGDTVEALLIAAASGAHVVQVAVPMNARRAGSATPGTHAAGHLLRLILAMLVRPPARRRDAS